MECVRGAGTLGADAGKQEEGDGKDGHHGMDRGDCGKSPGRRVIIKETIGRAAGGRRGRGGKLPAAGEPDRGLRR